MSVSFEQLSESTHFERITFNKRTMAPKYERSCSLKTIKYSNLALILLFPTLKQTMEKDDFEFFSCFKE